MPSDPNFINGKGRIAADLYSFTKHVDGYDLNHTADQINLIQSGQILGNPSSVEEALINLTTSANTEADQPFLVLGDGYDTWHAANGNINFDKNIPSLDLLLNPIFDAILNGNPLSTKYKRLQRGGVIVLKSGTYVVKSPITIPPGITIIGEGYGTKIINGNNIDFAPTPPKRKTSQTPNSVFLVKRDVNRGSTSDQQNINADSNSFMFQTSTKIMNMVIADNFLQPTVLGDNFWTLPTSITGTHPLIKQENCSNLELYGVYLVGKSLFGNVFPDPSIITSYHAIGLDTSVSNSTYPQSILKIDNCFIDNFAVPILWQGVNGGTDYLEVNNSKIRAFGYLNGDGASVINNSLFKISNCSFSISNNKFNNKGEAYNLINFATKNNPVGEQSHRRNLSSNLLDGFNLNTINNSFVYYTSPNTEDNTPVSSFSNQSVNGFAIHSGPIIRNKFIQIGSNYTVKSNDSIILCSANANKTIILPNTGTMGQEVIIKDSSGNAATYPITINCPTNIDGSTSFVLNQNYACVHLIANDGAGWLIV